MIFNFKKGLDGTMGKIHQGISRSMGRGRYKVRPISRNSFRRLNGTTRG